MTADEIIRLMADRGLRITDQRKSLAGLFAGADGYLSAKAVHEAMKKWYDGLSFDTVYRNLRLMCEMDVLEQFVFAEGVKFRIRCGEEEHHHHLICLACEKTMPLMYCPMEKIPGVPETFQIVRHKFEVFGYCDACKHELGMKPV